MTLAPSGVSFFVDKAGSATARGAGVSSDSDVSPKDAAGDAGDAGFPAFTSRTLFVLSPRAARGGAGSDSRTRWASMRSWMARVQRRCANLVSTASVSFVAPSSSKSANASRAPGAATLDSKATKAKG